MVTARVLPFPRDFWIFLTGQALSVFGSAFTIFALPLMVYQLTGKATELAFISIATYLPYLLFGSVVGALTDSMDRKRLMNIVNSMKCILIASVPSLYLLHRLSLWWIYLVIFANSLSTIFFTSAEFAAVPSLVDKSRIVEANSKLRASYSVAGFAGPLIAGALITIFPVSTLLYVDALSYLFSFAALCTVSISFNGVPAANRVTWKSLRHTTLAGLKYVFRDPVLRQLALMTSLLNLVGSSVGFEIVYYAATQLKATPQEIGILFAFGPLGAVLGSLLTTLLTGERTIGKVALCVLALDGVMTIALSLVHVFVIALVLWALSAACGAVSSVGLASLRQRVIPNDMLGRVRSISTTLAWSCIPIGTFAGGLMIDKTHDIGLVFGIIGCLTMLIPLAFLWTSLGHATA